MKSTKYRIISLISGCFCFFLVTLTGELMPFFVGDSDQPAKVGITASGEDQNAKEGTTFNEGTASTDAITANEDIASAEDIAWRVNPPVLPTIPAAAFDESKLHEHDELSLSAVDDITPIYGTPTSSPTPSPTSTPTPSPTPSPSPTPEPFVFTKAIANVNDFVNVREGASADTKLLGKLFKNGIVEVEGTEGEWTKITSGSLSGYIFSEYLHLGEAAVHYADKITAYNAEVTANSLNVRSEPNTECKILAKTTSTDAYPALLALSNKDWIAVQYDANTIAYLSSQYVKLVCNLKEAMSLREIAAAERAAKIEKAHVKSVPITYRDPITLTDEDFQVFTLVVASEAYWEPYEGQLAVANVILNRLLAGRHDTVYEVVTAPGQFEGYQHIDKYRSRDLSSCEEACREALSGKNNIGNYRYFHADYYVDAKDEWPLFTSWYRIAGHIFFKRPGW